MAMTVCPENAGKSPEWKKRKILLVDDVQLFVEQQKAFLDSEEFEVVCARGGKEALRTAKEARPDLVFMDLYMPDMDGDTCCRLLKSPAYLGDVPVVIITAGVDKNDFERSWQAGCDDIILKPVNRHYFQAIVKKYLPVEDRQAPRYVARLQVLHGVGGDSVLAGYSINLSTGGLFIETSSVLPVGTLLALGFMVPDQGEGKRIQCQARVAWINHPDMMRNVALPPGMGVQFLDLSLRDMDAIRSFIRNGALLPWW